MNASLRMIADDEEYVGFSSSVAMSTLAADRRIQAKQAMESRVVGKSSELQNNYWGVLGARSATVGVNQCVRGRRPGLSGLLLHPSDSPLQ